MEIFRQWGVERCDRERGLPTSADVSSSGRDRIAGREIGRVASPSRTSASRPARKHASAPRTTVEPEILRRHAEALAPACTVRILDRISSASRRTTTASPRVRARSKTGETPSAGAQYLIAADGARSPRRQALGITCTASRARWRCCERVLDAPTCRTLRSQDRPAAIYLDPAGGIARDAQHQRRDRWLIIIQIGRSKDDRSLRTRRSADRRSCARCRRAGPRRDRSSAARSGGMSRQVAERSASAASSLSVTPLTACRPRAASA